MTEIAQQIVDMLVQIIVVLLGLLLTWAAHKGQQYLEQAKQKDNLGIIDMVTDRVVALVEQEFKGDSGMEKREKAVDLAIKLLADRGIKNISREHIMADIENGVLKLKDMQRRGNYIELSSEDWHVIDGIPDETDVGK